MVSGPLGITVWGDALDLSTERAQVVFHYTNFLAFKNITNEVPSPKKKVLTCHAIQ